MNLSARQERKYPIAPLPANRSAPRNASSYNSEQAAGLPVASAGAPFKPYGIDVVTLQLPPVQPGVRDAVLGVTHAAMYHCRTTAAFVHVSG